MHILPGRTKCELLRNSRNFSTIYFSLKYAGIDILHCTFIRLYVHLGRRHYTSRAKCTIFPYAAKLHTFKLGGCMYVRSVTRNGRKGGQPSDPDVRVSHRRKKILIAWQIFLCKISRQGGGGDMTPISSLFGYQYWSVCCTIHIRLAYYSSLYGTRSTLRVSSNSVCMCLRRIDS